MKAAVIINPVSGGAGRAVGSRKAKLAAEVLAASGVEASVHVTAGPGHGYSLARREVEEGASLVFAWGGDGTVNEVGRALLFGPAALSIIRSGSGNGLARELGARRSAWSQIRASLSASERRIDAGWLGDRFFFNVAGVGLDAVVAARFNAERAGRRGFVRYVRMSAGALLTCRPVPLSVSADGETREYTALMATLANSRQFGSGAVIAPSAVIDDGFLDLVVVEARSRIAALAAAARLFTRTITSAAGVSCRRVRRVTISSSAPMLFHVDGEPVAGGRELEAGVHHKALAVRV
jgi:diacylglycerol kinase (ATP)